jgi:hypothetical protein
VRVVCELRHTYLCLTEALQKPSAIDRAARMRDGWIASPTLIREGTAPRVISIVSGCGDYGRQPNAVVLWRGFTSATPRPRHELCWGMR